MIKYITHGGTFHLDDVVAYAMFNVMHPNNDLIRIPHNDIEEADLLDPAIFVVDVGLNYDPMTNNFDHHQDSDVDCAALLFWNHYSYDFLTKITNSYDDELIQYLGGYLYNHLLKYVNIVDNNINNHFQQCKQVNGLISLSNVISTLNDVDNSDTQFLIAVEMIGHLIDGLVRKGLWFFNSRHIWDNKEIIVSNPDIAIYKMSDACIMNHGDIYRATFIIYPNLKEGKGYWKIRSLDSSMGPLIDVPKELEKDLVFIHDKRFIAIFKNEESMMRYVDALITDNNWRM